MVRLLALLALLASPDSGAASPPPPLRAVEVKNLGAAPVQLLLQRGDGSYAWGPYELGPHEALRVEYCPCSGLALELRSSVRKGALRYPLVDLSALLLSEDRWSEGQPIVRRDEAPASCAAASCAGPPFRISR